MKSWISFIIHNCIIFINIQNCIQYAPLISFTNTIKCFKLCFNSNRFHSSFALKHPPVDCLHQGLTNPPPQGRPLNLSAATSYRARPYVGGCLTIMETLLRPEAVQCLWSRLSGPAVLFPWSRPSGLAQLVLFDSCLIRSRSPAL